METFIRVSAETREEYDKLEDSWGKGEGKYVKIIESYPGTKNVFYAEELHSEVLPTPEFNMSRGAILEGITHRILSERRKHQDTLPGPDAWAKIASHKIVSEYIDPLMSRLGDGEEEYMAIRKILINFVRWQLDKDMIDSLAIPYEVAEMYLDNKV